MSIEQPRSDIPAPEQPTLTLPRRGLVWNSDFESQLDRPPLEVISHPLFGSEDLLRRFSVRFTTVGEVGRYGVLLAGKTLADFDRRIDNGERVVIGCAPYDRGQRTGPWSFGVAPVGEMLGTFTSSTEGLFPAVALPLSGEGLRAVTGLLHAGENPAEAVIALTASRGVLPNGRLPRDVAIVERSYAPPIVGMPATDVMQFCPDVVVVEPPPLAPA